MAGKAYKLAAKTVWSERSQLMEKSERKLRKRSEIVQSPLTLRLGNRLQKCMGAMSIAGSAFLFLFWFGLGLFLVVGVFLFVCLGKIKKMVLDIWRTKLLPRDYCGLKMGGNSNNKTKQGEENHQLVLVSLPPTWR